MTRSEKQKAAARAEDAPLSGLKLSPLCLVDLPHSLLVLVLRWVEALTMPGKPKRKLEDLDSSADSAVAGWLQDSAVPFCGRERINR